MLTNPRWSLFNINSIHKFDFTFGGLKLKNVTYVISVTEPLNTKADFKQTKVTITAASNRIFKQVKSNNKDNIAINKLFMDVLNTNHIPGNCLFGIQLSNRRFPNERQSKQVFIIGQSLTSQLIGSTLSLRDSLDACNYNVYKFSPIHSTEWTINTT